MIACPAWAVLVDLVGVPRLPVASLRRVRPLRRPPIMRIDVDGITVYFPYEFVYPEQYAYMVDLKRTLDARGHSILEMPTGTGKTVTLLSLILSYQLYRPELAKLVYCTRTVGEMDKVLHELRRVLAHRDKCYAEDAPARAAASRKALAVGLTTRRNLCLHPAVSSASSREEADALCRSMTASWARGDPEDIEDVGGRAPRRGAATNGSVVRMADADEEEEGGAPRALTAAAAAEKGLCEYFEGYDKEGTDAILPAGVYGIDELIAVGKERGWCPYYTARHALSFANVIVYNYQYLIDPKVAGLISRDLARECVVVFDEAHNIDNVCIDALSVAIRGDTLTRSLRNLATLNARVGSIKTTNADRLADEYARLVQGMSIQGILPAHQDDAGRRRTAADVIQASPVIPADAIEETVPGNIRKAEHFLRFLRRVIDFLSKRMKLPHVQQESAPKFVHALLVDVQSDAKPLRFCSERLKSLLTTLEVADAAAFAPVQLVADMATLLGTYGKGQSFALIFEPFDERLPSIPDPVLQLCCLDASLAMKPIFDRFQSVVLTSGTISPRDMYAKVLSFTPVVSRSYSMSLQRNCICPLIVSRGPDQVAISSKFDCRGDKAVVRNYGMLLVQLAEAVPDGIVAFFTSYTYMESILAMWDDMAIIKLLLERKLVFIETPDTIESSLALDNYRRSCDAGRGAIFLCVARGKVAEGIDFDRHYGRAVVMLGVPFQYTESRVLRARLEYMRDNCGIREGDFLSFDALRQASQCLGRVVRSKADYGIMVLADKRYVRADKRNKLPQWILELMPEANVDLDTDAAVSVSKAFLRAMAQPLDQSAQMGTALLSEADVRRLAEKDKVRTAALAEQRQNAKPVADAAPEPVQMQMDDDDDLADYLGTVAPDYDDDEEMQVLEETEAQLRVS